MKNGNLKTAIISLALSVILLAGVFSACKKDKGAFDPLKEVASIGDESISYALLTAAFESYADYYKQMGSDPYATKSSLENLQDMVAESLINDMLVLHHASSEGFEITAEKKEAARTAALSELEQMRTEYMQKAEEMHKTDPSKTQQQHFDGLIRELAKFYTGNEMSFEEYSTAYVDQSIKTAVIEQYREAYIGSLPVERSEVLAWIEDKKAQDRTHYTENPGSYFSDMTAFECYGSEYDDLHPACFVPEGYSRVRDIVVHVQGELSEEYKTMVSEMESISAHCADLLFTDALEGSDAHADEIASLIEEYKQLKTRTDELLSSHQAEARAKIDEAYRLLEDGASFTEVMLEYSEDPLVVGSSEHAGCEKFQTDGMLISLVHDCGDSDWSQTFKDIYAMTEKGSYSGIFTDDDGSLHIIFHGEDEPAGDVEPDKIYALAEDCVRSEKADSEWDKLLEGWRKDSALKVDTDAIRALGADNLKDDEKQ